MEFRDEQHRMAVKAAFIRVTSDQSWQVVQQVAKDIIADLERKAIDEDDKEKAELYRHDARGARRFWEGLLQTVHYMKSPEVSVPEEDEFIEVSM